MNLRISALALGAFLLILLLVRAISPGAFVVLVLLYICIAVGLLSVLISLFVGLGMMTFGAATQDQKSQARWTTYLMRSRVFAQGMTIICGVLLLNIQGSN